MKLQYSLKHNLISSLTNLENRQIEVIGFIWLKMIRIRAKTKRYILSALIFCVITSFSFSLMSAETVGWKSLRPEGKRDALEVSVPVIAEVFPAAISPGGLLTIRIVGRIEQDSHLYSIRPQGEFAPDPTKLIVTAGFLSPVSSTDESSTNLVIDDAFDLPLQVHKKDFWISRQYIVNKKTKPGSYHVAGYLLYQICSQRICSLPLKSRFNEKIVISSD